MAPGPTEPDTVPARTELDRLLASGPFPAALRAAIRASGLGLDRIRHRLRSRGASVSLASLSGWQSGRHQPESAASLEAVTALEEILGVESGALRALLGPRRRRGRRAAPSPLLERADFFEDDESVVDALRQFDVDGDGSLLRLSMHNRVRVGRNRRVRSLWNRTVLRAAADGPRGFVVVYDAEPAGAIAIRPLRGCVLGRTVVDRRARVVVAELLFGHALRCGDIVVMEHAVDFPSPFPPDQFWETRMTGPVRECVLEIEFTRPVLPARCVQFESSAPAAAAGRERVIALDGFGRACTVGLDLDPCRFGVRWEWPGSPARVRG
ncbi:hypothetical protein GCM10009760_51400 [Kitasatospora kazusensis]|uniref:XRE family transcriptional regulator n=1 Tax=Kitasatospora kazusensis TaxID=407974 RepID=A0ABP5LT95_9ACTN